MRKMDGGFLPSFLFGNNCVLQISMIYFSYNNYISMKYKVAFAIRMELMFNQKVTLTGVD